MRRFGVETDDHHHGPAVLFELDAENLLTAWLLAHRVLPSDRRPTVVFTLDDGPYAQATRWDYSPETGGGDPH